MIAFGRFEPFAAAFHIRVTARELRPTSELGPAEQLAEEEFSEEEIAEFLEDVPEYVRVSFEIVEVFKGESEIPTRLNDLPFSPGNCGLGLATSLEHVIFLTGEVPEFASFCSGSFGFSNREGTEIKPHLDRLRELAR